MITAIWLFLKGVPAWVYLAIALVAGVYFYGSYRENIGEATVRAEWKQDKLDAEAMAEEGRLLRQKSINQLDAKGVAKQASQAKTDQHNFDQVDKNVPNTLSMLPGSFRLQYDADATGQKVDDSGKITAAAVSPGTVAKTNSRNFAGSRRNAADLEELQAIVLTSGCFDTE